MNDIVIGVWVTAAALGSGTALWICKTLRADAGSMWDPSQAKYGFTDTPDPVVTG